MIEVNKQKLNNNSIYIKLAIIIPIIYIIIIGIYLIHYKSSDHSNLATLTTVNYKSTNAMNVSLEYPTILKFNPHLVKQLTKANTPLAYSGDVAKGLKINMAFSYLKIDGLLMLLNLSPPNLQNQIKNKVGDYIDLLNKKDPKLYNELYGSCSSTATNSRKQINLICVDSRNTLTTVKIIGFDKNYQYTVTMIMPDDVWNQHQKVWQIIEKSLLY